MSLSSEKRAMFESFWNKADVNKDGDVTIQELARVLRCDYKQSMTDREIAEMFRDVDQNQDGKITKHEFMSEMAKKDRRDAFKEVFSAWDKDKSGSLTRDELRQAFKAMSKKGHCYSDEQADYVIQQADKNGDGEIDLEEFLAFV